MGSKRQFLFYNPLGFNQVSALDDWAELSKIELTGDGGVSIDVNGQKIIGVPLTPVSADEAASKAYVDLVASGGVPATEAGQVLLSLDGSTFEAALPLTSRNGWLVNNSGLLLGVG